MGAPEAPHVPVYRQVRSIAETKVKVKIRGRRETLYTTVRERHVIVLVEGILGCTIRPPDNSIAQYA